MRLWIPALILAMLSAVPAMAHRLIVYATVSEGEISVETKFSNGRMAVLGEVVVFDGEDAEVLRLPIADDGVTRFEIPNGDTGLRIEVSTQSGHSDYWILTPDDLITGAAQ